MTVKASVRRRQALDKSIMNVTLSEDGELVTIARWSVGNLSIMAMAHADAAVLVAKLQSVLERRNTVPEQLPGQTDIYEMEEPDGGQ